MKDENDYGKNELNPYTCNFQRHLKKSFEGKGYFFGLEMKKFRKIYKK